MSDKSGYIIPDWPAPSGIKAFTTTRIGGLSRGAYSTFNLGLHVGDEDQRVVRNRKRLREILRLPSEPMWLDQIHGKKCEKWRESSEAVTADASYSGQPNKVCLVMTADCLPILICNKAGNWVSACHAGWRGLAAGVIENSLSKYEGNKSNDLIAWIGPAISQKHFEVGVEVKNEFLKLDDSFEQFFIKNKHSKFQFDFVALAKKKLENWGVSCFGGNYCSFDDPEQFYSYRRDGTTGRMASLIWFENAQ